MLNERFVRFGLIAGLGLVLAVLGVQAQVTMRGHNRGQLSEKDYKFVADAALGGIMEVQLGETASRNAQSDVVKSFGRRMVEDHSKANKELQAIAARKGSSLPTDLSAGRQAMLERLQNATGAKFDRAYSKNMVGDHKKDVREFQKAAQELKDTDLRAWAQKTLPVLEDHLRLAQAMESSVGRAK